MNRYTLLLLIIFVNRTFAQIEFHEIKVENFGSSMRGLYAVNDQVVWASGSNGVVMKTINGKDWLADTIPGCRNLDFRDVHAFNKKEALVMSSGYGGYIYRTKDGGETWQQVLSNPDSTIFLDGMDFWDNKNGMCYGDPQNGKLYLLITNDGGNTWSELSPKTLPETLIGEASFAASGTGITCVGKSTILIATGGGEQTRVFKSINAGKTWEVYNTPLRSGEASGVYSMTFINDTSGIIVGGNYLDSLNASQNCAITNDGGETWKLIQSNNPRGYRSCVSANEKLAVSCGRSGIDVSGDWGNYWMPFSDKGYYSCVLSGETNGWLVGRKGKLAKFSFGSQ